MPKIVSPSGKRTNQVKVNFNDDELSKLDQIKNQIGADRSSILRESFFKFNDLQFEIRKIYNDMNVLYTQTIKDTWDPYNQIEKLLNTFDELLEKLEETYDQKNIISTKDEIKTIVKSLKINKRELRQMNSEMDTEEAKFDKKMIELIGLLKRVFDNSKLFGKASIVDNPIQSSDDKKIVIAEVNLFSSEETNKILDYISDGYPVIVNYSNIDDIKKNDFLNIISGGAHVAKVQPYRLNEQCILYAKNTIF